MKIVIDIPEKYLNSNIIDVTLITGANNTITDVNVEDKYAEFQVLPKGHGRLKDVDALKTSRTWALVAEKNAPQNEIAFAPLVCVLKEDLDNAMTIIEADKEIKNDKN